MNRYLLPFAALLAAASLAPSTAGAAHSFDACAGFIDSVPATITTQGVWCLRGDVATSIASGAAISIGVNNVTIDCNGFKLGGLSAGPGTLAEGVRGNGRINATVRNCNIRGFLYGVNLTQSAAGDGGHLVENNRFDGNTHAAVRVAGYGSIVRGNLIRDSGGSTEAASAFGVHVSEGPLFVEDNHVIGVLASGDESFGIYGNTIHGGAIRGNIVSGVVATENGAAVALQDSWMVWVVGNRLTGIGTGVGLSCNDASSRVSRTSIQGFATFMDGCSRPTPDDNDIP